MSLKDRVFWPAVGTIFATGIVGVGTMGKSIAEDYIADIAAKQTQQIAESIEDVEDKMRVVSEQQKELIGKLDGLMFMLIADSNAKAEATNAATEPEWNVPGLDPEVSPGFLLLEEMKKPPIE